MPYINHPLALANVLTSLVVLAGGIDISRKNKASEIFTRYIHQPIHQQNINTPPWNALKWPW